MKRPVYIASRIGSIICPGCGFNELQRSGQDAARCTECRCLVSGEMFEMLRQIAALPDSLGDHPCECGHPQMRRLPDGTFYCPACRSEVTSVGTISGTVDSGVGSEAYRCGWAEGLFGKAESFVHNGTLARWEGAGDRLDYYRGHRAGRSARFQQEPTEGAGHQLRAS